MRNQPYNGHKNWTHWNVALWLSNDEGLYRLCMERKGKFTYRGHKPITPLLAAKYVKACLPERTPDGARYSLVAIKEAIKGLWED